jgi:hypothetical protein
MLWLIDTLPRARIVVELMEWIRRVRPSCSLGSAPFDRACMRRGTPKGPRRSEQ